MHLFVKKPQGTRKSYGLVAYRLKDRKTKEYIELPEHLAEKLASINAGFKSGTYAAHEAEALLAELIQTEYKRQGLKTQVLRNQMIGEANWALLESYWTEVYGSRDLDDEQAMRWKLERALRLVEPLGLATATPQELFAKIKVAAANNSQRRCATDRLNQLLRFAGRPFRLTKPKPEYEKVVFVTEKEFKLLVAKIADKRLADFATVLFGTGARLSEALAMEASDFNGEKVLIERQLSKAGKLKAPKRQKKGDAMVLTLARPALKRWLVIPTAERAKLRFRLYDAMEAASLAALKRRVTPHDLRHSHAVYLLERGASLTEVALQLRNTVSVCQRYYTGFEHTSGTLERLRRIV